MKDNKNKTDIADTTNWTFDDWYQNFRKAGYSHGDAMVSAHRSIGDKPNCELGKFVTCSGPLQD